jgi:hypothetical protein
MDGALDGGPDACRRRLIGALGEAGIGHRDEGGLLRLALGDGDDFVEAFSLALAEDGGGEPRITATLVTAPIVADRDRDRLVRMLRGTPLDYRLQRSGGRVNALAATMPLAPGCDLTTVRAAREAFDQLRDTLRLVERTLFQLRPEMADLAEAAKHEQARRIPDAIAAARRGLDRLRRGADARTRATHQVTLGGLLHGVGRTDEAEPLLAEGLPQLAAEDPWMGAVAEVAIAQSDLEHNRSEVALARCGRAVEVLSRVGSEQTRVFASIRQAQAMLACHRPDEARRLLRGIENRIDAPSWPGPPRLLAEVRVLMAAAFEEIGDHSSAKDYREAAGTAFRQAGADDLLGPLDLAGARASSQANLPWNEMWQAATTDPSRAPVSAPVSSPPAGTSGGADLEQLGAAMRTGDLGSMLDAVETYAAGNVVPGQSAEADHALGLMPLLRATQGLRDVDLSQPAGAGMVQDTGGQLLDWALRHLEIVDRQPRLESVADRERWMAQVGPVLVVGTMAALMSGKFAIAHVLIERARAQGLPDLEGTTFAEALTLPPPVEPSEAPPAAASDERSDERSDEQRRLDGVRAYLSDVSVTRVEVTDTGAETDLVGGEGAWRWSLWRAGDLLFWSLLEPNPRDGGWTTWAGFVMLAPAYPAASNIPDDTLRAMFDGSLGEMLIRLRRACGVDLGGRELPQSEVTSGELLEDAHDREPALASHLGRGLIPARLRTELRRRLMAGEPPLPLVVAPAATLADIPYGLLGIDSPTPGRPFGARLVEAAVVTMAPPSVLVKEPPGGVPGGGLDVPLAVVAPTDDLAASRSALDAVPVEVLGNSTILGAVATPGVEPTGPATREAVVEALRKLPAGAAGVLVWAGHAEAGEERRPMEARLKLGGGPGEGLSVGDLVLGGLHVPSRAVLFACATVGADHRPQTHVSSDIVEWWGFPVAMIHAGARAVAATGWRVFDTPAGVAVAADLAARARTTPDLATALRELQLEHLRAWERQRIGDRTFTGRAGEHHPHLWAAWTVVGVAGG